MIKTFIDNIKTERALKKLEKAMIKQHHDIHLQFITFMTEEDED